MPNQNSRIASRASDSGGGDPGSSRTKFAITPVDVRELYETARSLGGMGGAPYLNRLFDAASALENEQLERVRQILSKTRQEFEKSHIRLLRFEPEVGGDAKKSQNEARLGSKKKQVQEVLDLFDGYVAVVERMAAGADRARPQRTAGEAAPNDSPIPDDLPDGFQHEFESGQTADEQIAVVARYFEHFPVISAEDVAPASLYFLRTSSSGYLLRTSAEPVGDMVRMSDAITGKEVKPQPIEALLAQGRKGKFLILKRREERESSEDDDGDPDSEMASTDPLEARNDLLDRQLFNVLMLAVKQSGLKVSTELIVRVRDNEFRKGDYHDAFEKLNQLATRYEMLAARRKEELRRNDQWLASGQSGLSMREVEEAKLKNANERTRLEHASHRFGLVVEPLRILSRGE